MDNRPSFILFITDQHRADYLGCYGHPVLKTPHIDQLAAEGVTYDNFYVASPVCMPNRASLMTCRMPSSHGVRSNGIPLARRNVTFVEMLRAAGYDTALIGKSHLQPFSGEQPIVKPPEARTGYIPAANGLEAALKSDLDDPFYASESPAFWSGAEPRVPTPFYGFDHVELVTEHGDMVGGDYVSWLKSRAPDVANKLGPKHQLPHDYVCPQAVRTAVPEEHYHTNFIAERACAWLEDHRGSDRPFFLMVSWPDPHHPFNPPGRYWDMYAPEEMEVPAAFKAKDWQAPPHVLAAVESRAAGKAKLNGMGTIACTEREALEARALTCGMITMIDDAVGKVCDTAERAGLAENAVRIFTTDHGDHLGDHRLLFKGCEQYDTLTRVPFIWSDPKGEKGTRTHEIGQTIDIGSSILERARIEAPVGMHGQALSIAGGSGREVALIQYDHQRPNVFLGPQPRVHTIVDEEWRLSVYDGAEFGELYNLADDPEELFNLWSDSRFAQKRAEMMQKMLELEITIVDRAPLPTAAA